MFTDILIQTLTSWPIMILYAMLALMVIGEIAGWIRRKRFKPHMELLTRLIGKESAQQMMDEMPPDERKKFADDIDAWIYGHAHGAGDEGEDEVDGADLQPEADGLPPRLPGGGKPLLPSKNRGEP